MDMNCINILPLTKVHHKGQSTIYIPNVAPIPLLDKCQQNSTKFFRRYFCSNTALGDIFCVCISDSTIHLQVGKMKLNIFILPTLYESLFLH